MRLLFVVNPYSGSYVKGSAGIITDYLRLTDHECVFFDWRQDNAAEDLKQVIQTYLPERVIAVGGDGTINFAASCLLFSNIPLGIIPAGSANGLANELQIPDFGPEALSLAITGNPRDIHVTKINDKICLHLSDIGLNAQMLKLFESGRHRGKWGYLIAASKVLWHRRKIHVSIRTEAGEVTHDAFMIVIANATRYGTGAVINPEGKINDTRFELIVFHRISFPELSRMFLRGVKWNPAVIVIYRGDRFYLSASDKVHLQVDGEYLGKVQELEAVLLPDALKLIVPEGPIPCF